MMAGLMGWAPVIVRALFTLGFGELYTWHTEFRLPHSCDKFHRL